MSSGPTFVIVGASLGGAKAAEALRAEGFGGQIVLIGAEPHYPYERPPLSKGYLQGAEERDKIFVHSGEGWYAEHQIDLRLGTAVTAIDRDLRQVVLASGVVTNLYGVTAQYWGGTYPGWYDGTVYVPDSIAPNVQSRLPFGVVFWRPPKRRTLRLGYLTRGEAAAARRHLAKRTGSAPR